jgi:hypothetical protein
MTEVHPMTRRRGGSAVRRVRVSGSVRALAPNHDEAAAPGPVSGRPDLDEPGGDEVVGKVVRLVFGEPVGGMASCTRAGEAFGN